MKAQRKKKIASAAVWGLLLGGGVEAVWGLLQVYGYTPSNHALFDLTGSFYNPGPYSGWLALVLPVCLHEWLDGKFEDHHIRRYTALVVGLLILSVLPAGMSRSAWMAAALSSGYVLAMHYRESIRRFVRRHRRWAMGVGLAVCLLGGTALYGAYQLKKDSADGRLLMWKIAAQAVCDRPLTGYGWGSVAAVYGQAQEDYFAKGTYTATEEKVASAPEYVFNEYLQVALAWGVPALCLILLVVGASFCIGHRHGVYGLCGGLLSLAVFAFSSYPFQFPLFTAALVVMVYACVMQGAPQDEEGLDLYIVWYWAAFTYVYFWHYAAEVTNGYAERLYKEEYRQYYQYGDYEKAIRKYGSICEKMRHDANFMFEYGHALHKLGKYSDSNTVLKEALKVSGDPMIMNILGKNCHALKQYEEAEQWFVRSTHRLPGRIYPYYLLACLYADPDFYHREKLEEMVRTVMEKEPKVQSTAIREMREKASKLLENK